MHAGHMNRSHTILFARMPLVASLHRSNIVAVILCFQFCNRHSGKSAVSFIECTAFGVSYVDTKFRRHATYLWRTAPPCCSPRFHGSILHHSHFHRCQPDCWNQTHMWSKHLSMLLKTPDQRRRSGQHSPLAADQNPTWARRRPCGQTRALFFENRPSLRV